MHKRRYSGRDSKEFWGRINGLPEGPWRQAVYMAAVTLQDLEARVLQILELAEGNAETGISKTAMGIRGNARAEANTTILGWTPTAYKGGNNGNA